VDDCDIEVIYPSHKIPNYIMEAFVSVLRSSIALFISLLIFNSFARAQQANSDDVLDYLPAILAASGTTIDSCDLKSLDNLRANTTIVVSCDIVLNGETITLPRGIEFEHNGGFILDGTLRSNSTLLDSRVITSSVSIIGNAKLTRSVFQFIPSNWGIIETNTQNPAPPIEQIAFRNHININRALNLAVRLGAKTFNIGKVDAYFSSKSRFTPIIFLPSNMHFKMASNTILRVQPIDAVHSYMMLRAQNVDNVRVSGGRLIGSRLLHGPTEGATSLFWITGSRNVHVDNVHFSLGASGLSVNGISWYDFADQASRPYIPSEDIIITNNTFDSNQFNNLSVTDGRRIRIEGNRSFRAGNDVQNKFYFSRGSAPRIGILVEPASNGPGFNQRVEDVIIKKNVVSQTRTNSILAVGVFGVVLEGNTVDGGIGWTTAASAKVIDNTVNGGGIVGGFNSAFALGKSSDNVISGNTIRNCAVGIYLTNDEISVTDNQIINCDTGMQMQDLQDSEVYGNTITSNKSDSIGFIYQLSSNNVVLRNNTLNLSDGKAFNVLSINDEPSHQNYVTYVRNNEFNTSKNAVIANSKHMVFTGNSFQNAGIGFANSSDMHFESNTINSKTGSAFGINRAGVSSAKNFNILNNTITNTNGIRLGGYGVRINTVGSSARQENSNITLTGNLISTLGKNYGLNSSGFDKVTINDNTISNEEDDFATLFFRGNNSIIRNNSVNHAKDIQGNNNTTN